jgi:hypothetical protein
MSGFRTWTAGEVLTADNMQDYLQNQTVMPFANATARGTDLITTLEGQITYLEDTQKFYLYNGSSWVDLLPSGGTEGQPYVSAGASDPAFGDMNSKFVETTLTGKSGNYTVVAADSNTMLVYSGAGTITFPDILDTVGDRIDILANTTSTVSIAAGTGVTSWAGAGSIGTSTVFSIDTPYAAASVIKTGTGQYRVLGRVTA